MNDMTCAPLEPSAKPSHAEDASSRRDAAAGDALDHLVRKN